MDQYETLPIVPLRDVVVFPHMMLPFVIGRPSSTRALEHALTTDKRIFLAAQHDASVDDPQPADIFTMGCVAKVVQSLKLPDGNVKLLVEGLDRSLHDGEVGVAAHDDADDRHALAHGAEVTVWSRVRSAGRARGAEEDPPCCVPVSPTCSASSTP